MRGESPGTGETIAVILVGVLATAVLIGAGAQDGASPTFPLRTSRVELVELPGPVGTLADALDGEVCWVRGSVVNVRSRASTRGDVRGKVHDGDLLRCLEADDGWHRIEKRQGLAGALQVQGYIRDDLLLWVNPTVDQAVQAALATEDRSGSAAAFPNWMQALHLGQDSTEAWWLVTDAWLATQVVSVQTRAPGQGQGRGQKRLRGYVPCSGDQPTTDALFSMSSQLTTSTTPTFFVVAPKQSKWIRLDLSGRQSRWVGGTYVVDDPASGVCGTRMLVTGAGQGSLDPSLSLRLRDRATLDRLVVVER